MIETIELREEGRSYHLNKLLEKERRMQNRKEKKRRQEKNVNCNEASKIFIWIEEEDIVEENVNEDIIVDDACM